MTDAQKKRQRDALMRLAQGMRYSEKEVVKETTSVEDKPDKVVFREKVTTTYLPPDIAAHKLLMQGEEGEGGAETVVLHYIPPVAKGQSDGQDG